MCMERAHGAYILIYVRAIYFDTESDSVYIWSLNFERDWRSIGMTKGRKMNTINNYDIFILNWINFRKRIKRNVKRISSTHTHTHTQTFKTRKDKVRAEFHSKLIKSIEHLEFATRSSFANELFPIVLPIIEKPV